MDQVERKIYRFAEYELDTGRRIFSRGQTPLRINAKAFDLLTILIENNGNILEKDEILGQVWGGNLIEENNLTVQISKIRKLLDETKENPRFLKTIPGRGYCFTADVSEIDEAASRLEKQRNFLTEVEPPSDIKNEELREAENNRKLPVGLTIGLIGLVIFSAAFLFITRSTFKNAPFQNIPPQRLTSLGNVWNTTISPDGKYFAYILAESKGRSLWVQQIGSPHALPIVPALDGRVWGMTFSPDSQKIYYSLFSENNPDIILYQVSTLGGRVEKIKTDVGGGIAFSPDGQKFAFTTSRASQEKTFLRIANSDGSEEKTLVERKSVIGFEVSGNTLSWSPDGNMIAAIVRESDETGIRNVIIGINPHDGKEQRITGKRWTSIRDVVWLKDGSGLIITAAERRTTPLQIWHLEYPSGEARQIRDDPESYESLSVAADNGILALKVNQTGNLSVTDDARTIESAKTVASQTGGFNDFVWTSENRLAYISSADGSRNIWQMNTDGSDKKQLTKDAQIRRRLDFSAAGNYFVFDSEKDGKVNLWRTDAAGNDFRRLTGGDGESFPSISKDGSFIVYQNGSSFAKAGIWKINADGTDNKAIYPNSGSRPQISPDGKRVAFFFMDDVSEREERWRIAVVSFETGEILQKINIPPTTTQRFLRWTDSGDAIAFIDDKADESSIIVQPLDQSKPFVKFKTASGTIESFAWSGDGKRFAVNSSIEIRDAVLIKNK